MEKFLVLITISRNGDGLPTIKSAWEFDTLAEAQTRMEFFTNDPFSGIKQAFVVKTVDRRTAP